MGEPALIIQVVKWGLSKLWVIDTFNVLPSTRDYYLIS